MGLASEGLKGLARARALLDMGKAARMERAREMGFAARDYFHGSPDLRGVREGFSPRTIRARNRRTGEFEDLPQATYVTPDQSVARSYADPERAWDYQNAEEGVLPLRVRDEGLLEIDAQGKRFNQLPLERVREQIPESQRAAFDDLVDQYADPMLMANEGSMRTGDLEVIANKLGYPGFRIRNVRDTYSGGGRPTEIVAVYEPSRFRSPEAAFDPAKRGSSNLLAGVGAAAVGAGLLAPQEADAAPFGTLAKQLGKRTREAWHGSPHVYDQVDLSRMGTGEGAQAYGAGYYAAQRRGIAEEYRDQLTPAQSLWADDVGRPVENQATVSSVAASFSLRGRDPSTVSAEEWRERAQEIADEWRAAPSDEGWGDAAMTPQMLEDTIRQLEETAAAGPPRQKISVKPPGALYRLEIPDEDLLDWDAPLSEQPEKVRDVIRRTADVNVDESGMYSVELPGLGGGGSTLDEAIDDMISADIFTGSSLYRGIVEKQRAARSLDPQRDASKAIAEAGIPGIRYLDGVSRNAGDGTRNYVIFDDRNVNVVERNGEPIAAMPRGREEPMSAAAGFARPGMMAAAGAGGAIAYDPVEARQTARRKREIDELTDTLIRDWQRSVAAPRPETPRFETLAQLSEWARAQRTQGIPLYEQPLQTTADTLDRLAYGEYRRGREGLGTLAADAVMTAAEVFDPGTWAALGRQKQQNLINRITSARERANR